MANIPTYNELRLSIESDLKTKLSINSLIGKTFISAFSAVYAAKQKLQYIALENVNRNIYPDTCDEANLRRCGRIRLGRDVNPAVSGEYILTVSGEIGAIIPVNTTFSNKNGFLFALNEQYTFTDVTGSVQVRALTAGLESALSLGDSLQITAPISNVDSYASAFSEVTQPITAEDIEEYRVNVINSYRLLPQGGSRSDYRTWTEGVEGVREVYPYVTPNKAGEIDLYVEAFVADSTDGKGTPSQLMLALVLASFYPNKQPMGVFQTNFKSVVITDIDVDIVNISDVGKIVEISQSVTDYLYNIRPYIAGADISSDIYKGRMYSSSIVGLIVSSGVSFDDVIVKVDGTQIFSYEFINGKIPALNSITNTII